MGDPGVQGPSGLEPPRVFFLDRSLGRHILAGRLSAARVLVEPYHKHFTRDDAPDEEWIAYAAARGWIALTKDGDIRINEFERAAVVRHSAHLFSLTNANMSGAEGADAFLRAMPELIRVSAAWAGRPLFGRVHKTGHVEIQDPTLALPIRRPPGERRGLREE